MQETSKVSLLSDRGSSDPTPTDHAVVFDGTLTLSVVSICGRCYPASVTVNPITFWCFADPLKGPHDVSFQAFGDISSHIWNFPGSVILRLKYLATASAGGCVFFSHTIALSVRLDDRMDQWFLLSGRGDEGICIFNKGAFSYLKGNYFCRRAPVSRNKTVSRQWRELHTAFLKLFWYFVGVIIAERAAGRPLEHHSLRENGILNYHVHERTKVKTWTITYIHIYNICTYFIKNIYSPFRVLPQGDTCGAIYTYVSYVYKFYIIFK